MTSATSETWVKNTVAVDPVASDGSFTIAAPNTFAKEWLDKRFRHQIETTLARILGQPTQLAVVVEGFGRSPEAAARPRRRAEPPTQAALIDDVDEEPPAPPPPRAGRRTAAAASHRLEGPSTRPEPPGAGPSDAPQPRRVDAAPGEGTRPRRRPATLNAQPPARADE